MYDDMNGAGFMSSVYYMGIMAANAGLSSDEVTRQLAFKYVGIPFILISVVAIILICIHIYFPHLFHNGAAAVKGLFSGKGKPKSIDYESLDYILKDTGFAYDPEQNYFYAVMDGWQREFGYCRLYDEAAAPSGMIIDCEPIYFKYGGKDWLIELWKGQYGMTTGCEIGIFTTTGPELNIPGVFNGTFYNSASEEDRLQMALALKKNGKIIFAREDMHWWLTGFKLGEFSEPSELTMDVDITLKDDDMLSAFVDGLKGAGYSDNEMIIKGDTVSLKYSEPHTRQPITRTPATDWIMQKKNELLCEEYQKITGDYEDMSDKVGAIEQNAPKLLDEILNIRKTKQVLQMHDKFKDYMTEGGSKE
jgi:hypothetical protein